ALYDKGGGGVGGARGKGEEADRLFRQALAIRQRLAEAEPANTGYQWDLSVSYIRLGDLAVATGNGEEAERLFRQALAIRQRLAEAEPPNTGNQRSRSCSCNRPGAQR